jgi:hypothetical protein
MRTALDVQVCFFFLPLGERLGQPVKHHGEDDDGKPGLEALPMRLFCMPSTASRPSPCAPTIPAIIT